VTQLGSFQDGLNVAVFGASGGIGSEFVRQFADDAKVRRVYAFARTPGEYAHGKIVPLRADICDEASVDAAATGVAAEGKLDIVVVATGILHRGRYIKPEKALHDIGADAMLEVFRVNTVGPALVARAFLPRMRRAGKSVFAALSARVGSIGDNRLGGWTSYRSSKAALNMVLRTLSIEHARRFPESVIAGLHPGTVDSALSAPFQRNVPHGKLFSPSKSVRYLLQVIDGLTPEDTGGFYAWDGRKIEY
jgi:NAD(P)-dependent dehydrogenase (short-subunit alcohol dehydrogenase family)